MDQSAANVLTFRQVKLADGSVNKLLMQDLSRLLHLTSLIATGSDLGGSTAGVDSVFADIHIIEQPSEPALMAGHRSESLPHVHVQQGDFCELLPEVLERIKGAPLILLGGCHAGEKGVGGRFGSSLIDTLTRFARKGIRTAGLLIDDLRLLDAVSVQELDAAVKSLGLGYQLFIFGDTALVLPGDAACRLSPFVMAMTVSRLYDGSNLRPEDAVNADETIAKVPGGERAALYQLAESSNVHASEFLGLGLHYRFWYATSQLQVNASVCYQEFETVLQLGFADWRAKWYLAQVCQSLKKTDRMRELLTLILLERPELKAAEALLKKAGAHAPLWTPDKGAAGGSGQLNASDRPPKVSNVSAGKQRPLWSVMIPAFNPKPSYLATALKSVLSAGFSECDMQIEVLDNVSDQCDVATVVRAIAGDRVTVYRQPRNIGMLGNWNSCLERARGHYVHVLHTDDCVMPAFYKSLQAALDTNPDMGAAFCRSAKIDEEGKVFELYPVQRETPGVLDDFVRRMARTNDAPPPTVVVRRRVYEELGGFWSRSLSLPDWEMWIRIGASYPVYYTPETLACYRQHRDSASAEIGQTATLYADMGPVFDLFKRYLPPDKADGFLAVGRQVQAEWAVGLAISFAKKGRWGEAVAHARAATALFPGDRVLPVSRQIIAAAPALNS